MRLITLVAAAMLWSSPALAQPSELVPSPSIVRAHYDQIRKDWQPFPRLVTEAFLVGEDRQFYARYPLRSTVTRSITLWYPVSGMTRDQRLEVERAISGALTADEVAAWFINGVFLGQGCFGARAAAEAYFGRSLDELTLAQIAYLAALPKGPAQFHPARKPSKALERRNFILREMAAAGSVSPQDAHTAALAPLGTQSPLGECSAR